MDHDATSCLSVLQESHPNTNRGQSTTRLLTLLLRRPWQCTSGVGSKASVTRTGGVFAQRAHSANYYGDYPGNNPENHPPAKFMHNQFKTQKFKHLMLAVGPRDLNSAPYSPVHCSSDSMTSFQPSELTELPVVENSQLFAQRAHSACTAHGTPPHKVQRPCHRSNVGCQRATRTTRCRRRSAVPAQSQHPSVGMGACGHAHTRARAQRETGREGGREGGIT